MEASDPEHGLGNELLAELQAFGSWFVRRDVEFAEHPELMFVRPKTTSASNQVSSSRRTCPDRGTPLRPGTPRFVRRVLMVGEPAVRPTEYHSTKAIDNRENEFGMPNPYPVYVSVAFYVSCPSRSSRQYLRLSHTNDSDHRSILLQYPRMIHRSAKGGRYARDCRHERIWPDLRAPLSAATRPAWPRRGRCTVS